MKIKPLILALVFASSVSQATDYDIANKYNEKAKVYVTCAFYEGLQHLSDFKENNEHKLMKYAAENYIKSMHEYEPDTNREELLIDFASFTSAQQALLWDADPGLNTNAVKQEAGRLYSKANCPLLLDAIE